MFAKRKNDEARPYPWWLLVVGFAFGVIITVIVLQSRSQPVVADQSVPQEGIELTATAIIEQATQFAIDANVDVGTQDPEGILLTATAIIEQATQQAFATLPG